MRKLFIILLLTTSLSLNAQQAIVIDHNCIKLSEIPLKWIDSAKANLFIGYGHTSHGSQLTSGMNALESFYTNYNWSHNGGTNELHLFEGDGYGSGYLDHDCGYSGWDAETREYLDSFPNCNVIIWSWCGQVNSVNVTDHYLIPMSNLELNYPNVTFVYMTGHLEGLGSSGSLFQANQQIRDFCNLNNKILFDFADIEKYSPDCDTNYQEYSADDGCNYTLPGVGTTNWANNWMANNPNDTLTKIAQLCGSCAHSVSLNCVKKGIATWYLWARIAGWNGSPSSLKKNIKREKLRIFPNPVTNSFTVYLPKESENIIINICNLQGKSIYKKNFRGINNKITLSNFDVPKGIYLLQVYNEKLFYQKKIIRQ